MDLITNRFSCHDEAHPNLLCLKRTYSISVLRLFVAYCQKRKKETFADWHGKNQISCSLSSGKNDFHYLSEMLNENQHTKNQINTL